MVFCTPIHDEIPIEKLMNPTLAEKGLDILGHIIVAFFCDFLFRSAVRRGFLWKSPEIILKGYSLPLSTSSTLILAYRSSSHIFASSTSSYIFAIDTTRKCANCFKGGLLTLTS